MQEKKASDGRVALRTATTVKSPVIDGFATEIPVSAVPPGIEHPGVDASLMISPGVTLRVTLALYVPGRPTVARFVAVVPLVSENRKKSSGDRPRTVELKLIFAF